MKAAFLFVLTILVISECSTQKVEVEASIGANNGSEKVISAPIIEKPFYNKVGQRMDHTEFYVQQSQQDFFIKFCESNVTRKQLEAALNQIDSPIKTLTMKVEFREGNWDSCGDYELQSRVGRYVVLQGIK